MLTTKLNEKIKNQNMKCSGCVVLHTGAADNTRVALHFANAAKRVTMQPHVNEVVNQKALLRKLRDEVALLRKQLVSACVTAVGGFLSKGPGH